MKALLKMLSECYGPPGSESLVRELVREEIAPSVDEVGVDMMGNLVARREGRGRRVMLAAHMDESALVISHIDEKGFLRFVGVGALTLEMLPGERVVFANGTRGTIGFEETEDERVKASIDKMYIDIGASDRKGAAKSVSVGDLAVFHGETLDTGTRLMGKALGSRAACAVLIEVAKRIRKRKTTNALIFVFAVQGRVGGRGALTSAYRADPEIGIVVDGAPAGDVPEAPRQSVALGDGPAIKVKDSKILSHGAVRQLLVDGARREGIPYQLEVSRGAALGGHSLQMTKSGVPTGVVSIPCRYANAPWEVVDVRDVEGSVRLLVRTVTTDLSRFRA
jgi:putative aminopeptidase FrvX